MRIHVKARPPLARRCRCGYCFDAEGQELEVFEEELAALTADPMLVVTELEGHEAQTAPAADGDPTAPEEPDTPEGESAPEGDAPEGEDPEGEAA